MSAMQRFQRTVPRSVPEAQRQEVGVKIAEGIRSSLGMAPIRVFGVPPESHFAQVLVEADYRMKLIGIGLEQPPVKIASYFDLLGSSAASRSALQRWWFTPDYDCVKVTETASAWNWWARACSCRPRRSWWAPTASSALGRPATRPARRSRWPSRAAMPRWPKRTRCTAELHNLIHMTIAAAFIQQQSYAQQAHWTMAALNDEAVVRVRTLAAPRQAPAAVNTAWRGSRFVAVAGGGVSIRPDEALTSHRLISDKDGKVAKLRSQIGDAPHGERWWWD